MKKITLIIGVFFLLAGGLTIWMNPFIEPAKTFMLIFGILLIYSSFIMLLTIIDKKWSSFILKIITPSGKLELLIDYSFIISKIHIKGILLPFIIITGFWTFCFFIVYLFPIILFENYILTLSSSIFISLTIGTLVFIEFGNRIISSFANPTGIKKKELTNNMYLYLYWADVETEKMSLRILNQQRLLFVVYVIYFIILIVTTLIKLQCGADIDFLIMVLTSFSVILAYDNIRSKIDFWKDKENQQPINRFQTACKAKFEANVELNP